MEKVHAQEKIGGVMHGKEISGTFTGWEVKGWVMLWGDLWPGFLRVELGSILARGRKKG